MSQPYLHLHSCVLTAPMQVWSRSDGQVVQDGALGIYCGDERIASAVELKIDGRVAEFVGADEPGGGFAVYRAVVRTPDLGIDPQVVLGRERRVTPESVSETFVLTSAAHSAVPVRLSLRFAPDATAMDAIKAGAVAAALDLAEPTGPSAAWRWRDASTSAQLTIDDGTLAVDGDAYVASWDVLVPARGEARVGWNLAATDDAAPFVGVTAPPIEPPSHPDPAVERLLAKALADLSSLRLAERSGDAFLAAGSPWFLTLFGRDSLISARLLLPHDASLAASTLRVLAGRQGRATNVATAEQPGKILHEVRRVALTLHDTAEDPDGGVTSVIPPEYYGTVDATLLWVLLLADAVDAGLGEAEASALIPALRGALGWMRDQAAADEGGFLKYFDESGTGLSNQGWKDSGDSIRWADGALADGPIALVEVQGYAHAAALAGARLLDRFGEVGESTQWREWADALRERFDAAFWVEDERGRYPALALDAHQRAVTGVSSNMGHLLGTGILDRARSDVVVARLMDPTLASGYGVRTLSTDNGGYWPLGYHVGSVWTHDTAIIIDGLLRDGYGAEAAELARQLLAAAAGFNNRMPELFGGIEASVAYPPIPYPASCRPQAWAAASAVTIARALTS